MAGAAKIWSNKNPTENACCCCRCIRANLTLNSALEIEPRINPSRSYSDTYFSKIEGDERRGEERWRGEGEGRKELGGLRVLWPLGLVPHQLILSIGFRVSIRCK